MHKVVRGIDVFDVGRGQLMRFWHSNSPLYFHRYVECVCHTQGLELGSYVVVALSAKFGVCDWRPRVCDLFSSLGDALDAVGGFYRSRFYDARVRDAAVLADYEIWHVVDDEELWGPWNARTELLKLLALGDEIKRDGGVNVHVFDNPYAWWTSFRCEFLELCVYDFSGALREYYRMHRDKQYMVNRLLTKLTDDFVFSDGVSVPWRLYLTKYAYPNCSIDSHEVNGYWPVEDYRVCPF